MTALTERLSTALAGRYRIERELGAGGMATVYLAHDIRHDREVAIKVLHEELGATLGPERFLAEIKTTARLQHPHILPLLESGRTGDGRSQAGELLYYVMPFVAGESLRNRLNRERQLPIDDAVRLAREVADALGLAHSLGIVHRDIKPENILLQGGHALVADFGIALAVQQAGGTRMTQTGLSLGTPQYMAPEQAMGEKVIDARADIYALGAVTYEMLTGEPPFTGATVQAIVAKVLTEKPLAPTIVRDTVPPHVEDAILTALAKLPADRFSNAAEFLRALSAPQITRETGAARTRTVSETKTPRWRSILPWVVAGVGVAAGVVGTFRGGPAADDRVTITAVLPPDGEDFAEQSSFGALSADGRRFAFIAQSGRGARRLFVRPLDSLQARLIPGTEGASSPFWSPDGRTIAFFAAGRLMKVGLEGSPPSPVCDAPNATSGTWTQGGTILFGSTSGLMRGSASGGPCEAVIPVQSGMFSYRHPAVLPGGRYVVLSVHASTAPRRRLLVGDLQAGSVTPLANDAADATFIAPDLLVFGRLANAGNHLVIQQIDLERRVLAGDPVAITPAVRTAGNVFSYGTSTRGDLVYMPSRGDEEKLITDRRGQVIDTIRHRGSWTHQFARRRPLVAIGLGPGGIWQYSLDRKVATPLTPSHLGAWPVWSPNDSLIAYSQLVGGIRLLNLATGADSVLVDPADQEGYVRPTDWSRDGRTLLVTRPERDSVPRSEIWAFDLLTKAYTPAHRSGANVSEGALSPDGRWMAYRSDETGVSEVFVRPFRRAGEAVRVSSDGGRLPRWDSSGRLYFQSPDGRIFVADVRGVGELAVGEPEMLFRAAAWGRRMFFDIGTSYDVSPDGQRFVLRISPGSSEAVLITNWPSLVPRTR